MNWIEGAPNFIDFCEVDIGNKSTADIRRGLWDASGSFQGLDGGLHYPEAILRHRRLPVACDTPAAEPVKPKLPEFCREFFRHLKIAEPRGELNYYMREFMEACEANCDCSEPVAIPPKPPDITHALYECRYGEIVTAYRWVPSTEQHLFRESDGWHRAGGQE